MKAKNLIKALRKMDPEADVRLRVSWAKDDAITDPGDLLKVHARDGAVLVEGWMSNCTSELEFVGTGEGGD